MGCILICLFLLQFLASVSYAVSYGTFFKKTDFVFMGLHYLVCHTSYHCPPEPCRCVSYINFVNLWYFNRKKILKNLKSQKNPGSRIFPVSDTTYVTLREYNLQDLAQELQIIELTHHLNLCFSFIFSVFFHLSVKNAWRSNISVWTLF